MKKTLQILILLITTNLTAQNKNPEDFGFRHLSYLFKGNPVDILIKSKKGEEEKPKPLFFFCQGSLPIPLIIYEGAGIYGTFPFDPEVLTTDYHIVIIGKPFIPLIADANILQPDLTYIDSLGNFPKSYSDLNLLDYYVNRNIHIIKYLQKQSWIIKSQLIVAGHSEGSSIAAKMALKFTKITHLIYSGGNPMGRIITSIAQSRTEETAFDSISYGNEKIKYWEAVLADKNNMSVTRGDTYKATYQFSVPPIKYLEKLRIPVLVTYGTKDVSASFNDYLQIEIINKKQRNFTFLPYIGTEHNYFPIIESGKVNYSINNWNKVVKDWQEWLKKN